MFDAYDFDGSGKLSWEEWKNFVSAQNIQYQNRGDSFWMQEHMNFNYIDSSRDALIDKKEYKYYLDQIGLNETIQEEFEITI